MVLFPTSDLSKAAAKVLKKELKLQLTLDLAQFMNQDFAQTVAKYSEPSYLKSLVGRYYQKQSNQFLDHGSSETEPNK
jgi:hypothetical protein